MLEMFNTMPEQPRPMQPPPTDPAVNPARKGIVCAFVAA